RARRRFIISPGSGPPFSSSVKVRTRRPLDKTGFRAPTRSRWGGASAEILTDEAGEVLRCDGGAVAEDHAAADQLVASRGVSRAVAGRMQLGRGGVEVRGHRGAMAGDVELEEAAGGLHGVSLCAADDGIPAGAAGGGEEALVSAEQRGIAAAEEDLVRAAGSA